MMVISAHFDETPSGEGASRDPRRTLRLDTTGALHGGGAAAVRIHNVSATGLLIETDAPLAERERIAVDLPQAGDCWAHVVWQSGTLFGCRFDQPISAAALSAAQLRSAVDRPVEIESGAGQRIPDGSFGLRLQRLRAERGLSQSRIAQELGVSKPTVWAWEHGKARPVESRLDALAELLGVTRGDLGGRRAGDFADIVSRSREQIAAAHGVSPDKVRITIEL